MIKVRQVIINNIDLKKLLKKKGITLHKLSKLSGVDYGMLWRAKNGNIILGQNAWNKIKQYL